MRPRHLGLSLPIAVLASLPATSAARNQAASTSVRDLVQVADLSGLAVSPDGRTIAFRTERATVEGNSYVLEWRTVGLDGSALREVGGGGEPIYRNPGLLQAESAFWSPDNRFLYYRALVDGRIGLWRAKENGSGTAAVVVGDSDLEAVEAEAGGKALFYRVGPSRDEILRAEREEYDAGILVDEHVDLAQGLFKGGWINGRLASQRLIGRWFERADLLWRGERRRRRLDLETLADTPVSDEVALAPPDALPQRPAVSATSAGGDMATAAWDGMAGSLSLRRRRVAQTLSCTALVCREKRIFALLWRPGRDQLLLTVEDRHHGQSLYLWEPGTGEPRLLLASDGLLSGSRDPDAPCAIGTAAVVCVTASAVSPPRLERIDLETGHREILFDPNADLRARPAPVVERLAWTTPAGHSFTGLLLMPAERPLRRLPLFLSFYRCEGFLRGAVGDEWPLQPLVAHGFAAACVNAAPIVGKYDAVATYDRALQGIRSLVERLEARGTIDRGRIAMGGLSFGSEVTMWVASHSDLLAAASISSTQLEPGYYWFNAVRGRDQPRRVKEAWGLGPPDETRPQWQLLSSALNVERIKAPILMQLPEQEARYVIELYARLTNSPTPTELYAFPDEAHVKLQPRHKMAVYERNLDWFRFWLQDYVDPEPRKAEQYRRWRALADRRRAAESSRP